MESSGPALASVLEAAPPSLAPWPDADVRAGFMGRRGGVSRSAYASFNLSYWIGDDPAAVAENWRRWHVDNPGLRPVLLNQVHGNKVLRIRVGDPSFDGERAAADGMVTKEPDIVLCIFSADCVPVLLWDNSARIVAAFHAGWRGTLAGIASEGIRAMIDAGGRPDRIRVALGPSIGPCCFEVDADLANQFACRIPFAREFTREGRPGKAYLDLREIIRRQLEEVGLDPELIEGVGPCTRCNQADYFSRRAAGGAVTGLQMSFIALEPSSNA